METSLKTGFAQIFSCCPKNLSRPKFGGAAAPLAPLALTPMPMPVSCFNDSRMVGATRCANSKVVGMSFLDRIWLKTFSTTSVKVATSLRKLVALFFLTCLAFLAFSFPFCVFPCGWFRQRHSDDSVMTLIVMYFNNSLTIWNTKMNAIDKEKKSL